MTPANSKGLKRTPRVLAFFWLAMVCILFQLGTKTANALQPANFARHQVAGMAGTYQGRAATKDPAKRVFTLNLMADGTAMLTTLYIGKDNATQHGRWSQTGSQIVLTFDAMGNNQPPRPITFRYRSRALSPIRWDASEWGRSGPPVLHFAPTPL